MAVVDVQGAPPGAAPRFKGAAPVAAAGLGIVVAVVGGTMMWNQTGSAPAPPPVNAPAQVTQADPTPPGPAIPGVQFNQPPAAKPGAMGIEIVVKFKDDSKVKEIVDAFWKNQADPVAARAKFDAFKAGHPAFAGLKLDRVTYSNELVLVHEGGLAPPERLAAMREIVKKLGANADISYAEPNMTAQAGAQ